MRATRPAHYGWTVIDATTLKSRWVEILDELELGSRSAWLAMFDGRIAKLENGVVELDFSDATKFAGVHGYERDSRSAQFISALEASIMKVTGESLKVVLATDNPDQSGESASPSSGNLQ